jgi:hypothetical protein
MAIKLNEKSVSDNILEGIGRRRSATWPTLAASPSPADSPHTTCPSSLKNFFCHQLENLLHFWFLLLVRVRGLGRGGKQKDFQPPREPSEVKKDLIAFHFSFFPIEEVIDDVVGLESFSQIMARK